jgi:hypothetical protein
MEDQSTHDGRPVNAHWKASQRTLEGQRMHKNRPKAVISTYFITDNSPALQRWEYDEEGLKSPARDERKVLPSLRDSVGWFGMGTQR